MEEAILKIVGYVSDNRYQYPKTEKEFRATRKAESSSKIIPDVV
ncbi:hypothetical protein TYRP_007133 [Tyrophagus putrescentiae]|nr:hypothetical protein TYRP_007133 [Tyrophagus putrescentiae]